VIDTGVDGLEAATRTAAAQAASRSMTSQAALSTVRSFNRFELKYLVPHTLTRAVRDELGGRMAYDLQAPQGGYQVWSCYYDTRDLRFYWEKIDGIRFRRKLRVRHYGAPTELSADRPVYVEIKQRVNRVTQKRRSRLRYRDALDLCAGRVPDAIDLRSDPVSAEICGMAAGMALAPVSIVGYLRQAFVGHDADGGLRITIDTHVRGRDRDLDLAVETSNRRIISSRLSVLEIKANERIPYWVTELVARHSLQLVRVSKYCQSVEAFGRTPRSVFHVADDVHETR
jgi:hypothetical protein